MKRVIKFFCSLSTIVLLAIGLSVWYFSPIFNRFPEPTGPHAVGTTTLVVIDQSRQESHTHDQQSKRELLLTIYYPSSHNKERIAATPYQPSTLAALKANIKKRYPIPTCILNRFFKNIKTYANPNAPVIQQLYPVILFSHGIGGFNLHETYLAELASWGYIIVAVTHPYDTQITVFPDGRMVALDPTLQHAMKHTLRPEIYEYRTKAHALWLDDLNFVTNTLETWNNDQASPWYQKLDLKHLGVMGFSHGGWVAADFCKKDSRCKAGIDLDGWTKTVQIKGFTKPFMFLLSEQSASPEIDELHKNMGPHARKITIAGARHGAFEDWILLKQPLTRWLDVTSQNPNTVRTLINRQIRDFFDTYLKQKKQGFLS